MKVQVLKMVGQTGFRPIGTEYEVPYNVGMRMSKLGFVKAKRKPPKAKSK